MIFRKPGLGKQTVTTAKITLRCQAGYVSLLGTAHPSQCGVPQLLRVWLLHRVRGVCSACRTRSCAWNQPAKEVFGFFSFYSEARIYFHPQLRDFPKIRDQYLSFHLFCGFVQLRPGTAPNSRENSD